MPALITNQSHYAQLVQFASQGNILAEALLSLLKNTYYVKMTPGAEAGGGAAANTIRVLCQVTDQDGKAVAGVKNILLTSVPVSGVGTMTDGGLGTIKAGSGSKSVWMQTDSAGKLEIDVLNAAAEDNLLMAQLDNGTVETVVLTFA